MTGAFGFVAFSGRQFRMTFLCHRRITRWAALSSSSFTRSPLFFVDETPDGAYQMGHGNVNTPFPENLRDPMHTETAAGPPGSLPCVASI